MLEGVSGPAEVLCVVVLEGVAGSAEVLLIRVLAGVVGPAEVLQIGFRQVWRGRRRSGRYGFVRGGGDGWVWRIGGLEGVVGRLRSCGPWVRRVLVVCSGECA